MDNSFRQDNIQLLDFKALYSAVVGVLPVVMCFKIPIVNIGLSTALICLFVVFAVSKIKIGYNVTLKIVITAVIVYLISRSLLAPFNVVLLLIVYIHLIGFSNGTVDSRITRRTIELVSYVSSYIVIVQTLLYYVFGIRSTLLVEALLIDENKYYVANQVMASGMYRPSAFFLEPSHFAEYCCIGLLSILFPEKNRKSNKMWAIVIALGCLCTTSGIGIGLCLGVFIANMIFSQRKKGARLSYIISCLVVGAVVAFLLMRIPFVQTALQRVVGDVDGYNAIWGRTLYWDQFIGTMSPIKKFFGYGYWNRPTEYMTGAMLLIYCYGYVGVALLLCSLIYIAKVNKNFFVYFLIGMYVALMNVANLFGFISLVFWYSLAISSSSEELSNV